MIITAMILITFAGCGAVLDLYIRKQLNKVTAIYLVSTMIAAITLACFSNLGSYFPFASNVLQKLSLIVAIPACFATYWIPTLFPSGLFIICANYLLSRKKGTQKTSVANFLRDFANKKENQIVVVMSSTGLFLWLLIAGLIASVKLSHPL